MTRLLALLAALLLLAACGSDTAAPPLATPATGPAEEPAGDYVADGLPSPFEDGDTLRVTVRDGEISFHATCNTMSGRVAWEDGELRISNLGGTEMGCQGAGLEQDEWLVDFFSSSPDVTVDGTDVRLASGDDEIWLVPAHEVDADPGPD
ncbi:MAG: META domain-containing protein, partial [Nocardioides sp.]